MSARAPGRSRGRRGAWALVAALGVAGWLLLSAGLPPDVGLAAVFEDPQSGDAAALARARALDVLRIVGAAGAAALAACCSASARRGPGAQGWALQELVGRDPLLGGPALAAAVVLLAADLGHFGFGPGPTTAALVAAPLAAVVFELVSRGRSGARWIGCGLLAVLSLGLLALGGSEFERHTGLRRLSAWAPLRSGGWDLWIALGSGVLGLWARSRGFGGLARGLLAGSSVVFVGPLVGLGVVAGALGGWRLGRAAGLAALLLTAAAALAARVVGPDAVPAGLLAGGVAVLGLGSLPAFPSKRAPVGAERGVSTGDSGR